jgi:diacylglycerol kinase family enzyme
MESRMGQVRTCILNEKAGSHSAAKAQALIARVAAERGVGGAHPAFLGRGRSQFARRARLVRWRAGRGHGTIAAVAAALVGTDIALGVLPVGTLNHFAKDPGIPLDLERSVQTLFTGEVARLDVGEGNERIFLGNSSIGLYPWIVRERERQQRQGYSKWLAFAQAAALVVQQSRALHVELNEDHDCRRSYDAPFVFVGNNRYALTGLEIDTRAVLDGGKLWVCAAPYASRFRLLALAVGALLGLVRDVDLAALETNQISVHMRRRPVQVVTDGEVNVMQMPPRYRIRPGSLRVVVPTTE